MRASMNWLIAAAMVVGTMGTGCGANMAHSQFVTGAGAVADGEHAVVVFMRPKKLAYKINAAVYDGEKFVAIVPYNGKFAYAASPGRHLFMVVSEAADFMTAELEAGKTYYAEVRPRMGVWKARFSLRAFSAADLQDPKVQQWIAAGQWMENLPSAQAWADQHHHKNMMRRDKFYLKWQEKTPGDRPHLAPTDGQ